MIFTENTETYSFFALCAKLKNIPETRNDEYSDRMNRPALARHSLKNPLCCHILQGRVVEEKCCMPGLGQG